MKKVLFIICATMLAFAAEAKNDEMSIEYDQIPAKAQSFVSEYFPNVAVKKATQKFDDGIAEYTVYLKNKAVVKFDMVGGWNEVEVSKKSVIPTGFLPKKVSETLNANFDNKSICKMSNDGYVYVIKYSDGFEAKINANGVIF
ncbi:MAG: PepSY-like domain-containing protein [Paludibacteraceae bacterium]|nr:PepSY-like domain-containing protein [Paludibacteraceae bacterium]